MNEELHGIAAEKWRQDHPEPDYTSPAAREARRQKWLAERLAAIVTAHRDLEEPSAIELLREACEQWEGVE